jgi:hypothetical protein
MTLLAESGYTQAGRIIYGSAKVSVFVNNADQTLFLGKAS